MVGLDCVIAAFQKLSEFGEEVGPFGLSEHWKTYSSMAVLYAAVLHGWISCRRLMQVRSGALFVTSNGESVDTNDITQMMYKLGQCAGYGPKFLTSHSFRAGYANRKAAEVLASGGTWQDVLDHLSDGHTWSKSSKAVHSYLNPNLKNFFGAGYRYTLEQFELLCPTEIHDFHSIQEPTKRPLTWFHHSPSRLRLLCARVGWASTLGIHWVHTRGPPD